MELWRSFIIRHKMASRSNLLALLGLLLFCYAVARQPDWRSLIPSLFQHPSDRSSLASPHKEFSCSLASSALPQRAHTARLTDFGGVGDGLTLNTRAFERAMADLQSFGQRGGAQLIIPAGNWLTGCFNLTSHLTLHLERGATILASQDPSHWPLIDPLPSYGRGRERPGSRYSSLVHGQNLVDVVITGDNGTIDGQGSVWWNMWWNRSLQHTRGHLVEFISSKDITMSNIVLRNSPFWTVHPVYCNNVIVKNVTILAPSNAPNTDGIDPDSSSNVCIEDCYISNGDDLIAIKSGWDQYGMKISRPSSNITIRRVTGTTATCSGIAFGSEISGGITNVTVEDVHVFNSSAGIRLKTAPGRGGYVTNITISGMTLENVKRAIEFSGDAGEHPDEGYNRSAFSVVTRIVLKGLVGEHIKHPGRFVSVPEAPFWDICMFNISINVTCKHDGLWACTNVHGSSYSVSPILCPEFLQNSTSNGYSDSCTIENP